MDEGLFDFEDQESRHDEPRFTTLTPTQRLAIRDLFDQLGVRNARAQFDLVAELTGVRIKAVHELEAATANVLIPMLRGAVARAGQANTGNAWADRAEDTWIDRL